MKLMFKLVLGSGSLILALSAFGLEGCDLSCAEIGAEKCVGASTAVCGSDHRWKYTECYEDYCASLGYHSGTCVEQGSSSYCSCGG